MSTLEKLREQRKKYEERIALLQNRKAELDKKIAEQENLEIIGLVRSLKLTPEELGKVLRRNKMKEDTDYEA